MTNYQTTQRLEKAILDFKECLELDERSSAIQNLIEDLEAGVWDNPGCPYSDCPKVKYRDCQEHGVVS